MSDSSALPPSREDGILRRSTTTKDQVNKLINILNLLDSVLPVSTYCEKLDEEPDLVSRTTTRLG